MRDRRTVDRVTTKLAKIMKCFTGLSIILILAIVIFAVQARKRDCPCGGLGSGTNLCSCSEIVVKAAKLPKPAAYASPQVIAQAAAVRERLAAANGLARATTHLTHAYSAGHHADGSSGCSCNVQAEGSLDIRDLIKGRDNVVPSFPPIGDLCYPLPMHPRTGEMIERITTVIPARPGKPRCNCHMIPHAQCMSMLNGHQGQLEHKAHLGHQFYEHYDHNGQYDEHEHLNHKASARIFGEAELQFLGENRNVYDRPSGMFGQDRMIEFQAPIDDEMNYGRHSIPSRVFGPVGLDSTAMFQEARTGASMGMTERGHGVESRIVEEQSDCNDEMREVQVSPKTPADAVSLALAYKNMHAPHVIYKAGRKFVPEDKIAFGHRTMPAEVKVEKNKPNIPEEKLVVLDKPVVELQVSPTKTVVIGSYDEKEEARLAELEAVEREYIAQEETPPEPAENYVSYGELGYAPVGAKPVAKPMSRHMSHGLVIEKGSQAPCGPLGPPLPGYVPGSVIVQEYPETEETNDADEMEQQGRSLGGQIYEEDDSEEDFDEGSGFLSRLRALSRKHGLGICPH